MVTTTSSSGLFGNLGANQGRLNTKRGKSFLWKDATRRLSGKNMKMKAQGGSKEEVSAIKKRMQLENTLEDQKRVLVLINSALLAALALLIIV